jgi:HSP20 family protein
MARRIALEGTDFDKRIHEHLERAYQRVFGNAPGSPGWCTPYMEPPVDVYQTETHVVVLMEIAGIPREEIEISVDGRDMLIRGERKPLPGRPNRSYSQMEIAQGAFQRQVLLPAEVNPEALEAVYKDGILEIVLPKAAPARGRQLRIVVR